MILSVPVIYGRPLVIEREKTGSDQGNSLKRQRIIGN